ncbi:hypothetical protein [Eubacterium maltosivorans]|uniref:hypothetical protein n=1 Tax=Eubacterium maltosivorans TaxID=2041044 RepID=UPI00189E222E|nr:hypothetical protein [Eubacterium maltosivorans]
MGALEEMVENMTRLTESVNEMTDKIIELQQKIEDGGMAIWTRKDLIEYLDGSEVMARYLIDQPDFPKYMAGTKSKPLFCKQDVIEYIRCKANCETEGVPVTPVVLPVELSGKGKKSALYGR